MAKVVTRIDTKGRHCQTNCRRPRRQRLTTVSYHEARD